MTEFLHDFRLRPSTEAGRKGDGEAGVCVCVCVWGGGGGGGSGLVFITAKGRDWRHAAID